MSLVVRRNGTRYVRNLGPKRFKKKKPDHKLKSRYRSVSRRGRTMGEHRWIMQEHLGRPLSSEEHVHHLDDNGLHNPIDNLQVKERRAHARMHGAKHRKNLPKEVLKMIVDKKIPVTAMSKLLGLNRSTIYRKLRHQAPNRSKAQHPFAKRQSVWKRALDMFFSRDHQLDEIVKITGISRAVIYARAKLDSRYDRMANVTTQTEAKIIAAMYLNGYKISTIAVECRRDRCTVCRIVKRLGLKRRKPSLVSSLDNFSISH